MRFFIGTHVLRFLADVRFVGRPLFVSARRLRERGKLPRAVTDWACDSGGFTELTMFGHWQTSPAQYVAELAHWSRVVGRMVWAAPQDWMCEEFVCASTALAEDLIGFDQEKFDRFISRVKPAKRSPAAVRAARVKACLPLPPKLFRARVLEHQRRTVANFLELRTLAPQLPIIPVLQGWTVADYVACAGLYRAAGVDLTACRVVGVGSVCRRQGTAEAANIIRTVRGLGIKPHGFGFKAQGVRAAGDALESADSLAWSFGARMRDPLPGCRHGKDGLGNCGNCPLWALKWANEVVGVRPEVQPDPDLFGGEL